MGRLRKVLAVMTATMALAPGTPAPALPIGPPVVDLEHSMSEDVVSFTAIASDPDGLIAGMQLCIEGGPCVAWQEEEPDLDPGSCLFGDTRALETQHTFPGPGVYTVTVSATGTGCPVLGARETVTESFEITVAPSPPPHDPIVCRDDAAPTASAPGVTAETVTLAATVPMTGPSGPQGKAIRSGLVAATLAVNRSDGVCGRRLVLRTLDDAGDETRRRSFIEAFDDDGDVFALAGQDVSGAERSIQAAGFPAVGSYAHRRHEFAASWIWPIRAGNDGFGWIAVDHAYAEGARTFALVSDSSAPFGHETREAVEEALARYDDATLVHVASILPARASYAAEIQAFNEACEASCDAVIYALDGGSMLTWLAGRPYRGEQLTIAHPLVFNERFAMTCGGACDGILFLTDAHPAVGSVNEMVARACDDVRSIDPTADCTDPYLLAAYSAVWAAARAMGAAGTELTRDNFRRALDASIIDTGLHGGPLSWDHPRRHANRWLRGYSAVIPAGSFAGFRPETGWLEDPRG